MVRGNGSSLLNKINDVTISQDISPLDRNKPAPFCFFRFDRAQTNQQKSLPTTTECVLFFSLFHVFFACPLRLDQSLTVMVRPPQSSRPFTLGVPPTPIAGNPLQTITPYVEIGRFGMDLALRICIIKVDSHFFSSTGTSALFMVYWSLLSVYIGHIDIAIRDVCGATVDAPV